MRGSVGNVPTKFTTHLFAMATAIKSAHRSAVIRRSVDRLAILYFSPGFAVNEFCKNSLCVGPGQNIVTSMLG